jgi:hypothetical protein
VDHTPKPNLSILDILGDVAGRNRKHYCFPSQLKIAALLAQRTGRRASRATINRHLRALERDGWIHRQRRHRRGPTGALECHSTLYTFTRRAARYFAGFAFTFAVWLGAGALTSAVFPRLNPATISVLKTESGGVLTTGPPPKTTSSEVALRALTAIRATLHKK